MISCDNEGTVKMEGSEADLIAEFMVICTSVREMIVSHHFDNSFQVNAEMIRIIKEVNHFSRRRSGK